METYFLADALAELEDRLGRKVTHTELSEALGCSQGAVTGRLNRKSDLKYSDIIAINRFFNVSLFNGADAVEIKYYNNPKYADIIKCPKITSLWLDRQLVNLDWELKEENLRIIAMPGDNMNGGANPIPNGAKLLIDITSTNILRSGIYAYMTKAGLFVNRIKQKANGDVEFIHKNADNATYTKQEIIDMHFEPIGRVIIPLNIADN